MQTNFANVTQRTTDWQSVKWRKANRVVKNLRQRIYSFGEATLQGNPKTGLEPSQKPATVTTQELLNCAASSAASNSD